MEIRVAAKKVADSHDCLDCEGITYSIRLEHEDPNWGGITRCEHCNSERTVLKATGLDIPNDPVVQRRAGTWVRPETATPLLKPRVSVVAPTVSPDTYSEAITLMAKGS